MLALIIILYCICIAGVAYIFDRYGIKSSLWSWITVLCPVLNAIALIYLSIKTFSKSSFKEFVDEIMNI